MTRLIRATAGRAVRWHVHSQQGAVRNAMVASTALAERRRELTEVEDFLARHQRRYDARARRLRSGRSA